MGRSGLFFLVSTGTRDLFLAAWYYEFPLRHRTQILGTFRIDLCANSEVAELHCCCTWLFSATIAISNWFWRRT